MRINYLTLWAVLTITTFFLPPGATAQSLTPATIIVLPTQMMHEGKLANCGITIGLGSDGSGDSIVVTEVQMQVWFASKDKTFGSIAYTSKTASRKSSAAPTTYKKIISAWTRLGDGSAFEMAPLQVTESGAVVAVFDYKAVVEAISQIAEVGPRIQVGIELKDGDFSVIYTGVPFFKEPSRQLILGCLREMKSRLATFPK